MAAHHIPSWRRRGDGLDADHPARRPNARCVPLGFAPR